ncbi:hypothetical protein C1H46_039004 [Malus baccata]|uniref:Ricin B lectin domain-containing protein n=1 Tax=Malus baccata TaxID=106549 RepID=A0A540KMK6_MALBA|nr:hypothetical protein C1H46_039004 [Malus baccata]
MTISSDKPRKYVMNYECDKANSEATKWVLSTDGTIINPHFGLVLTAHGTENGTSLIAETNVNDATQGWKTGDDVEPTMTSTEGQQAEATMSTRDGTIQENNDHSRCITSHGQSSEEPIVICKCEGSVNQRWVFKYDGTILNPNMHPTLVMDVRDSNQSLEHVILYPRNGNPYQQWVYSFSVHGCHAS